MTAKSSNPVMSLLAYDKKVDCSLEDGVDHDTGTYRGTCASRYK